MTRGTLQRENLAPSCRIAASRPPASGSSAFAIGRGRKGWQVGVLRVPVSIVSGLGRTIRERPSAGPPRVFWGNVGHMHHPKKPMCGACGERLDIGPLDWARAQGANRGHNNSEVIMGRGGCTRLPALVVRSPLPTKGTRAKEDKRPGGWTKTARSRPPPVEHRAPAAVGILLAPPRGYINTGRQALDVAVVYLPPSVL